MTHPFEARLAKYVDLDAADDAVGIQALYRIEAAGVARHRLGLVLDGDLPAPLGFRREDITWNRQRIDKMTN